jgi:uncharacterized phosphosugar-binding protein
MTSPSPQETLDVARHPSAAYVAYAHGSGMDYTRKKYADHPVGKFWLEVAELVIEAMSTAGEDAQASQPKGPIQ